MSALDAGHPEQSLPTPTLAQVKQAVHTVFGLSPGSIESHSRLAPFFTARAVFCQIARTRTNASISRLGWAMGGRFHTNVIYYLDWVRRERDTNLVLARALDDANQALNALLAERPSNAA